MNVLITVNTYNPKVNGVQFVTSYLAEGLASRGHQVDVITYADKHLPVEEAINGVHVRRWDAATVHMFHRGDKKGYRDYLLSHQSDYDVLLQVGTQSAMTDWALPVLKKLRIPKALHIHSVWDFQVHPYDRDSARRLLQKLIGNVRWACHFIWNRRHFARYDRILQLHEKDYSVPFMKRLCGKDSDILTNAVEDAFFLPGSKGADGHTVVYVANYSDMKNQKAAVDIFDKAELPQDWKLVLIGAKENGYVRELREMADRLRREKNRKIEILVGISREETIRRVRDADVFLMPSRREAFPISILEAMAAKTPFISTDVGIVKYLPGGIVTNDPQAQVSSLQRLALDAAERMRLAEEGYQYASRHAVIDAKVQQLEQTLQELISRGNG